MSKIIFWTKEYWPIILFFALLGAGFYFFSNAVSYFDPLTSCYISLDNDLTKGNQATMTRAIKMLKRGDGASYKTMCRYINRITEKNCRGSDPRGEQNEQPTTGGSAIRGWESIGCYIKGSKEMYLKVEKDDSDLITRSRMDAIKKYSERSKFFWENLKKQ